MQFEIRGEPGPKKTAQLAFDQANAFYECALRCAETQINRYEADVIVSPTTPMITSIAFASELYLKSFIFAEKSSMPETHRLDRLYNSLSREIQKAVRRRYAEIAHVGKLELSTHLVELSNAFVDWRYIFEKTGEIRTDRLFHFARSLFEVTRKKFPEWSVSAHTEARISEGPTQMVLSTISLGGGYFVRVSIKD